MSLTFPRSVTDESILSGLKDKGWSLGQKVKLINPSCEGMIVGIDNVRGGIPVIRISKSEQDKCKTETLGIPLTSPSDLKFIHSSKPLLSGVKDLDFKWAPYSVLPITSEVKQEAEVKEETKKQLSNDEYIVRALAKHNLAIGDIVHHRTRGQGKVIGYKTKFGRPIVWFSGAETATKKLSGDLHSSYSYMAGLNSSYEVNPLDLSPTRDSEIVEQLKKIELTIGQKVKLLHPPATGTVVGYTQGDPVVRVDGSLGNVAPAYKVKQKDIHSSWPSVQANDRKWAYVSVSPLQPEVSSLETMKNELAKLNLKAGDKIEVLTYNGQALSPYATSIANSSVIGTVIGYNTAQNFPLIRFEGQGKPVTKPTTIVHPDYKLTGKQGAWLISSRYIKMATPERIANLQIEADLATIGLKIGDKVDITSHNGGVVTSGNLNDPKYQSVTGTVVGVTCSRPVLMFPDQGWKPASLSTSTNIRIHGSYLNNFKTEGVGAFYPTAKEAYRKSADTVKVVAPVKIPMKFGLKIGDIIALQSGASEPIKTHTITGQDAGGYPHLGTPSVTLAHDRAIRSINGMLTAHGLKLEAASRPVPMKFGLKVGDRITFDQSRYKGLYATVVGKKENGNPVIDYEATPYTKGYEGYETPELGRECSTDVNITHINGAITANGITIAKRSGSAVKPAEVPMKFGLKIGDKIQTISSDIRIKNDTVVDYNRITGTPLLEDDDTHLMSSLYGLDFVASINGVDTEYGKKVKVPTRYGLKVGDKIDFIGSHSSLPAIVIGVSNTTGAPRIRYEGGAISELYTGYIIARVNNQPYVRPAVPAPVAAPIPAPTLEPKAMKFGLKVGDKLNFYSDWSTCSAVIIGMSPEGFPSVTYNSPSPMTGVLFSDSKITHINGNLTKLGLELKASKPIANQNILNYFDLPFAKIKLPTADIKLQLKVGDKLTFSQNTTIPNREATVIGFAADGALHIKYAYDGYQSRLYVTDDIIAVNGNSVSPSKPIIIDSLHDLPAKEPSVLKKELTSAGYRVAATQATSLSRNAIVSLLKKNGADNKYIDGIGDLLNTEFGRALVSLTLGITATHYANETNPRLGKFAKECRIQSITTMGNSIIETVISSALEAMRAEPEEEVKSSNQQDLLSTLEEEQFLLEETSLKEQKN